MRIVGFKESNKPLGKFYKADCVCGTQFVFASEELDSHNDIECPECKRKLNINNNVALIHESGNSVKALNIITEISEAEYNGTENSVEELDMKKKILDSLFRKFSM